VTVDIGRRLRPERAGRRAALRVLLVLVATHVIAPPMALAYIDPLSGSVLLQALVAGVLGALLALGQLSIPDAVGIIAQACEALAEALARMSEMGRSFWAENRRVANAATKAALGVATETLRLELSGSMGIRTIMITGDNALTAAAIAAEAGVDDFMAQATPEDKLRRIRQEQADGHLVAMTGDGTNDARALAQSDVGVAMNTGTQAAREAGNMVDLDSDPTKLIEVVEIGKQLLMTRGALTTFSIANDVAKYFAIIPALFAALYAAAPGEPGPLAALNVMALHSPQSAILSATIFNALIIVLLIPLALRGVSYKPLNAAAVLRRNLLIYGVGGLIAPFIGIKLIDLLITLIGLV